MKKMVMALCFTMMLCGCASTALKAGQQDFDAQNYSAALQKMRPLAEKGNADAQYAVGYMLYYGKGTPVNRKDGVMWIQKAAAQGLPEAEQAEKMLSSRAARNPMDTQ